MSRAYVPSNGPHSNPAVRVEDLTVTIGRKGTGYEAVSELSFDVQPGETLAIVGESGCGKSLTALSLMRLLPAGVSVSSGRIEIGGVSILDASERVMTHLRGSSVAMIFQDPMTSLNPLVKVGRQISEALRIHKRVDACAARKRALELLELVGVSDAAARLDQFPHELSGGMRQRVMIAGAMACQPQVLIADEPTTALDVTVQAQILALLKQLQAQSGMALVLITHDIGVVAQMADKVVVMYAGRIVERGPVGKIFARPEHPYTRGLLSCSRPGLTKSERMRCGMSLEQIPGTVIPIGERGRGCNFADRCPAATAVCRDSDPRENVGPLGHGVRCWHCGPGESTKCEAVMP